MNKVQFRSRTVRDGVIKPVFSKTISRPGYNEEQWDSLQHRAKNRWLDRARQAACMLFNDMAVVERLPCLTKNLLSRV
jgi:hypothetical protein